MYKIGVVGDYDSICGFAALGADIFVCSKPDDAKQTVRKLSQSGYGIIYITEPCYTAAENEITAVRDALTPSFIPIPSVRSACKIGRERMKKYVEQAVGSDIIYND